MSAPISSVRVSVLQHVPFEGPASIARHLQRRGHHVRVHRMWLGELAPSAAECDMLVVMGGPMSVGEHDRYPWLVGELKAIRSCIDAAIPVLGVCLGAQLIAAALGARVYPARSPEIGWWPVDLGLVPAAGDARPHGASGLDSRWARRLSGLPARAQVMQWHGDTFDLPDGAVRIGSTSICPNQAFLYAGHVLALQFHLESTPESVSALVRECGVGIGGTFREVPRRDAMRAFVDGARAHGATAFALLVPLLEELESRVPRRLPD